MFKNFFRSAIALLVLGLFLIPSVAFMQTQSSTTNDSLVEAIRQVVLDAVAGLRAEITSLRQEITELRVKVNSSGGSGATVTQPDISFPSSSPKLPLPPQSCNFSSVLGVGDTGNDVRRLQEFLGIAITGVYDTATKDAVLAWQNARPAMLARAGLTRGTGYWGALSHAQCNAEAGGTGSQSTPARTQTQVIILKPLANQTLYSGGSNFIEWRVDNAPSDAWLMFLLRHKTSGAEYHVQGPTTAGSGVYGSNAYVTANLNQDNYDLVVNLLSGDKNTPKLLHSAVVSVKVVQNIVTTPSTQSPSNTSVPSTPSNTSPSSTLTDEQKYASSEFAACMNAQGSAGASALAKILGWVNSGAQRNTWPWGELTGEAANAVPPCEREADIGYDYNYEYDGTYEWDNSQYGVCDGLDQNSCTTHSSGNCYWLADNENSYCYYQSDSYVPSSARDYRSQSECQAAGWVWYANDAHFTARGESVAHCDDAAHGSVSSTGGLWSLLLGSLSALFNF